MIKVSLDQDEEGRVWMAAIEGDLIWNMWEGGYVSPTCPLSITLAIPIGEGHGVNHPFSAS